MEHVLQNIKNLRIIRSVTQAQMAAELNIGSRQYNNLENGKSIFNLSQINTIAKVLNIEIALLFSIDPIVKL
jgi:transcriptional regulator with XRE-family HTH domain